MIPPAVLFSSLRTSAPFPGGPAFDLLCQALAASVVSWLPLGVGLAGATTGVSGAGTVAGTIAFTGSSPAVLAAFGSLGGPNAPALATVIAAGLTAGLAGLTYAGTSAGVALGTDISAVTRADVPSLAAVIRATHSSLCASQGGTGSQFPAFYDALANGIVSVILTGVTLPPTGVVSPVGPPGPSSAIGTSISSIV